MATAIRLARRGSKKHPTYRIVVADARSPRDGRFIETIGFYNPQTEPSTIEVDEAKAKQWLANGARPSDAARRLLAVKGIV
jgi:small subunit ribosomal protein S16